MNHRTPGGEEGAENKRAVLARPTPARYRVFGGIGEILATTHRNFSRSSGSSVAHGTLEIIRRALRKGGVQRLRWRSGKLAAL